LPGPGKSWLDPMSLPVGDRGPTDRSGASRDEEGEASSSQQTEAEAHTAAALRHFTANEHERARQAVERALALDPTNRRARELQRILRVLG